MGKETFYFSHDANARNDEKILMLRAEYGWQGYGIYWALIEQMFENTDTCLSKRNIKGIAMSYGIDITLLQSVIDTCMSEGLFVSDDNTFWSNSLRRRKQKYHEIKNKHSEAGKKGMAKRWGLDNGVITNDNESYNDEISENNKGNENINENENEIIMSSYEAEFISVLRNIKDYPLDKAKDLAYMKTLEARYPDLDLAEAIKKFSVWVLDNPFKKNANHRSQINTSFGKYVEWGACLKREEPQSMYPDL